MLVHPGDEVEVDIRGRVFPARITGRPADRRWPIQPLVKGVGYYAASTRQIKRVLHRAAQLQLGEA